MRSRFTESGVADALISIWIGATGLVFALLPLLAGGSLEGLTASIWELWRVLYVAVLLISASGAALRVFRRMSSRRTG